MGSVTFQDIMTLVKEEMAALSLQMTTKVEEIKEGVAAIYTMQQAPSTSSLGGASQRLRPNMLAHYDAESEQEGHWCVATSRYWPHAAVPGNDSTTYVRAAHIIPRKWREGTWVSVVCSLPLLLVPFVNFLMRFPRALQTTQHQ